jgi:hypothetical protein
VRYERRRGDALLAVRPGPGLPHGYRLKQLLPAWEACNLPSVFATGHTVLLQLCRYLGVTVQWCTLSPVILNSMYRT